ncbi:MAG: DASS family sodium-coupled anion symporter [Puniceicoccaceae bacterium]|nr:MAG: DASS family sodium-coupled anion symporter [Puniceicoccaceae bacterium]
MIPMAKPSKSSRIPLPAGTVLTAVKVLVVLALAAGSLLLPLEGLGPSGRVMLAIFIGAAGLWITEAIPPFATAIAVIVLQIYLLGLPGSPGHEAIEGYQIFLNPLASPILVLFFGGFILAISMSKHGLDKRMAMLLLKPFGRRPAGLLLGVIMITAVFSMFMSNTATTAMMIAILAPIYTRAEKGDPFIRALLLAVPFAANIGGIGTVIGTPPNAVAASVLGGMGYNVTFIGWMIIGFPLAVCLLMILWLVLLKLHRPGTSERDLNFADELRIGPRLIIVGVTFATTVLLWMTEPLHGIPSAVVALAPIFVFTTTGIITRHDLKSIDWDVLVLVAGGLSLGIGMERSGLATYLVDLVPFETLPLTALMLVFAVVTVVISNFMSNTSAANLLIPIAAAIAVWSPVVGAMVVAFSASLAMSLPVSTPPNAIAYASGLLRTSDMARTGTLLTFVGVAFVLTAMVLLNAYTGLLEFGD